MDWFVCRYADYARSGADVTGPALARLINNNALSLTSVDVSRNRLSAEALGFLERMLLKLPFRSTTLRELRVDENADEAARVRVYHAHLRALCVPHGDTEQQLQQFASASNATLMRQLPATGGATVTKVATPTRAVEATPASTPPRRKSNHQYSSAASALGLESYSTHEPAATPTSSAKAANTKAGAESSTTGVPSLPGGMSLVLDEFPGLRMAEYRSALLLLLPNLISLSIHRCQVRSSFKDGGALALALANPASAAPQLKTLQVCVCVCACVCACVFAWTFGVLTRLLRAAAVQQRLDRRERHLHCTRVAYQLDTSRVGPGTQPGHHQHWR